MRRLPTDELVHLKAHLAQLEVENDQLINKLVVLSESGLDYDRAVEHLNALRLSCKRALKFLQKVNPTTVREKTALQKALDALSSALLDIEE